MSSDWTIFEVEATVADYFAMLQLELRGVPYNKSEHRRRLLKLLDGRSETAVEPKHMNISAVLRAYGHPWIDGYKPFGNYQQLLCDIVVERLATDSELRRVVAESPAAPLGLAGEEYVLRFEAERLHMAGHKKLADRIEHVSATRGDGLGFDILSFEANGQERLIEVKTTSYGKRTPFFVSRKGGCVPPVSGLQLQKAAGSVRGRRSAGSRVQS